MNLKSFVRTLLLGAFLSTATLFAANQAFDEAPRPTYNPAPSYPSDLQNSQVAAKVVLTVYINEQGEVTEVQVRKSTDERFNDTALNTVKSVWKFSPATLGGKPVSAKLTIPVRFEPQNS